MNEYHDHCGSDEWRNLIREVVLPWALGNADLGEDVVEVGPGYGATTDVLADRCAAVTAVEIDGTLAAQLVERYADRDTVTIVHGDATALDIPSGRFTGAASFTMLHHVPTIELQDRLFAEVARVLRPGALFVASDAVGTDEMQHNHEGDTYNPIDPSTLDRRLRDAGFADVSVRTNEQGWAVRARTEGP